MDPALTRGVVSYIFVAFVNRTRMDLNHAYLTRTDRHTQVRGLIRSEREPRTNLLE